MPLPLRSPFSKNKTTSGKKSRGFSWVEFLLATGYVALILLMSFRSQAQVVPPDAPTPWWMSYVGGAEQDEVRKIVQDPTGNYLVGSSGGFSGWPSSTSPIYQGGPSDAFVIRLSNDHEPVWHKSLGGTDADFAFDAVVDFDGNIYVTGTTASLGLATTGAYQETLGGLTDAFVMALNSDGEVLWHTYIGGTLNESYSTIALTGDGQLIVAVSTASSDLPSTGSLSAGYGGGMSDVFLVSLSLTGEANWGGYVGGSGDDRANTIVPWGINGFLFGGESSSPTVAQGGFQTTYAGGGDGWLAAFDGSAAPQWSTFIGGAGKEVVNSLDIDSYGMIAAAGSSNSMSNVSTIGPAAFGGGDAFLIQLSNAGARLWSRYLGGSGLDQANAVKMDAFGQIYVAGTTNSPNAHEGNWTDAYAGAIDGYLAKVMFDGTLGWSGYIGGSGNDEIYSLAMENGTRIFFGGKTASNNSVRYGFDESYNGLNDGWFGLFQDCLNPEVTINLVGDSVICDGDIATFFAGGADQYEWMNADTAFAIEVDTTQLVYVVGSSASGCRSRSRVIPVVSLPVPEVTIYADGPVEFCDSGTVMLHALGAPYYEWDEDNTGESFLAVNQGPVSVTGIGENGCSSSSNVILILYNELPDVLMAVANDTVCISDGAVSLIGLPLGGNFVGDGVSGSLFNPFNAGGGSHPIYYEYTSEEGCYVQTPAQDIEVFFSPTVLFLAEDTLCFNDPELLLLGLPEGGAFSGDGVIDNLFYPSLSGVGPQNITYSYLDDLGCTNIANQIIIVDACNGIREEADAEVVLWNTLVEDQALVEVPFNTPAKLHVFDSTGRWVKTQLTEQGMNQVDMSFLNYGIYFLRVEFNSFVWVGKVCKI
jgi:hypothetical protein